MRIWECIHTSITVSHQSSITVNIAMSRHLSLMGQELSKRSLDFSALSSLSQYNDTDSTVTDAQLPCSTVPAQVVFVRFCLRYAVYFLTL